MWFCCSFLKERKIFLSTDIIEDAHFNYDSIDSLK